MKSIIKSIGNYNHLYCSSGLFFLLMTLFLMPFPRTWSLYTLGAFLFSGFLLWISDFKSYNKLLFEKGISILPLVVYFFLNIFWLWSASSKWIYIETNLMFLLIPIMGFPIFTSEKFQVKLDLLFKCFVFGILAICLFEFLRAAWITIYSIDIPVDSGIEIDGPVSPFKSYRLSFLEHPTYLTIKVLFAISILLFLRRDFKMRPFFYVSFIFIFLVFVFFLSSRTGILITLLLTLLFLYYFLKKYRLHILLIVIIPLILFGAYKISTLNPRINYRTELLIKRYKTGNARLEEIDPRFTTWATTIDLIREKPLFGVGLDARDILASEYKKQGYKNEASLRLNSHNQFLETQLTFGITGTLVLLWILFSPLFRKGGISNPVIYKAFLIIIIASSLFESMLVRQWGIMFFVLFYCIQVFIPLSIENR
jgi:O-antigen ligase